ncbi:unnamed protein product [Auanema sp. JU1783]|nr:unnamed protein product [Auanema sp. JU1783]
MNSDLITFIVFIQLVIPSTNCLKCFQCQNYGGERSICSASTDCTSPICYIVHFPPASTSTEFVSGCYPNSLSITDYCYTDTKNRTMCACLSQYCNTLVNAASFRNTTENLIKDLDIDVVLSTKTARMEVTTPTTTVLTSQTTSSNVPPPTTATIQTTTKCTVYSAVSYVIIFSLISDLFSH